LAVLHVVLARGTYTEQYMLTGVFVWLMAWRVLDRYGLGADLKALTALALTSCLFTALLEAGFFWGRRGYAPLGTLANNFNSALFEISIPPAWQVLAFGLLFVLAAASNQIYRARALGKTPTTKTLVFPSQTAIGVAPALELPAARTPPAEVG
jgi:hypothetical protein